MTDPEKQPGRTALKNLRSGRKKQKNPGKMKSAVPTAEMKVEMKVEMKAEMNGSTRAETENPR